MVIFLPGYLNNFVQNICCKSPSVEPPNKIDQHLGILFLYSPNYSLHYVIIIKKQHKHYAFFLWNLIPLGLNCFSIFLAVSLT